MDSVEHTTATSRRGYSPKATFNHAYEDVIQIVGKTHMTMTPTVFSGMRDLMQAHPELKNDPRLALDPPWLQNEIKNFDKLGRAFLPPRIGHAQDGDGSSRRRAAASRRAPTSRKACSCTRNCSPMSGSA